MITTWPDGTPMSQGNAFTSVPPRGVDKPSTAPKKRGPKVTKKMRTLTSLETPAERAMRHALRNLSPSFNVAIPSAEANARTNSIAGRPMDARSQ